MRFPRLAAAIAGSALLSASGAGAATITLSLVSSDATPASQLDATLEIAVGEFDLGNAGDELKLTLTNPAGGDALFNVNSVWWNAIPAVTSVSLLSATHSAAGDVFAAWNPVEIGSMVNGFGTFRFGLTDGVGEMNANVLEPGESVVFILSISGTGPFTDVDFVVGNSMSFTAAAKFVNGPDDPEDPGNEDSAFGAVPEPGTASLLGLGLLGIAAARRRLRA